MKKLFALLFAFVLSLSLFAGCKETPKEQEGGTGSTEQTGGSENDGNDDEKDDGKEDGKEDSGGEDDEKEEIVYTPWDEDGVLKILAIGNSYSDDSMEYVYEIAKSLGIEKVKLGIFWTGTITVDGVNAAKFNSAAFDYRVKDEGTNGSWLTVTNHRLKDTLQSENWDFVTFQQQSLLAADASSYQTLGAVTSVVRRYLPHAKFGWNMTWGYESHPDASVQAQFEERFQGKSENMWRAIVNATKEGVLSTGDFALTIPTGTAVQNARTSFIGKLQGLQMTRDGYHMHLKHGRYAAGLTVLHALTGIEIDVSTVYAPSGLSESYKKVCIESAKNAVAHPYEVTQSVYTEE